MIVHRKCVIPSVFTMGRIIKLRIAQVIMSIIAVLLINYFFVTPYNFHSSLFWVKLWVVFLAIAMIIICSNIIAQFWVQYKEDSWKKAKKERERIWKPTVKLVAIIFGILFVTTFIANFTGAQIFNAARYAKLIDVEDSDNQIIPEYEDANIALMDTESAKMLGDREIGELESFSAYSVSDDYVQLNVGNEAVKASALDYTGFFKWYQNRANGVPGYVTVSATSMKADYIELKKGMKYTPGAYFGDNLRRHIQSAYPTEMIYETHFEVDEKGNPYFIASTYKTTIGLFGGEKITGAIIVDPITGKMDKYAMDEIPEWVDIVVHGDLIVKQYNLAYKNINGWWNGTDFGANTGCRHTTNDYGYVIKDDDVYLYTGVTSYASDNSNLGFILVNERTGDYRYIPASGANEQSAMASAEGLVQDYGYNASFPSLVTINKELTYLGVMTDSSKIVRRYYMVNVEDYGKVSVKESLDAALADYTGKPSSGNAQELPEIDPGAEGQEVSFIVDAILYAEQDGNTYVYLGTEDGDIYISEFSSNQKLLFAEKGDTLTGKVQDGMFILEK